jgi:hypothetical protein
MQYYKAFKRGSAPGKYRSRQGPQNIEYVIGVPYVIKNRTKPELCKVGYHACTMPIKCFGVEYGYYIDLDVLGIVELSGETVSDLDKTACLSMKILKILTEEEKLQALSMVVVIDEDGIDTFIPVSDVERIATIKPHLEQYWYKNGMLHRDGDMPAIVYSDGTLIWYNHGQKHRDNDKPAVIYANGDVLWYRHGIIHRGDDKPAVIYSNYTMQWYLDGIGNRLNDKPSSIYFDGGMLWTVDGKTGRKNCDLPYSISPSGCCRTCTRVRGT